MATATRAHTRAIDRGLNRNEVHLRSANGIARESIASQLSRTMSADRARRSRPSM